MSILNPGEIAVGGKIKIPGNGIIADMTDIDGYINLSQTLPLPSGELIIGSNSGNVVRQLTLDDIAPAFGITGFSLAGTNYSSVVEVGVVISSITATASYTSTPASGNITDTQSGSWTLVTPFTSGSRSGTITNTANNSMWLAELSVTAATTKTAIVNVYWQPKIYHGVSATGTYNSAFITGLASSNLQSSKAISFTDTMGSGQYDFYALPSSYGTPIFQFGALVGGWSLAASAISVTNAHSVTQNYDLWITNQPDLGSILWSVS